MESHAFQINTNRQFPYFAKDSNNIATAGRNWVWFVKGKGSRRGYVKAHLLGKHNSLAPFEHERELKVADITKLTRARITFNIGSNFE